MKKECIKPPENHQRKKSKISKCRIRLICRQSKYCRNQGNAPSLNHEAIATHSIYYTLNETKMCNFFFHTYPQIFQMLA